VRLCLKGGLQIVLAREVNSINQPFELIAKRISEEETEKRGRERARED
jgi:hypothetical protein